jgi:hypothetical protein
MVLNIAQYAIYYKNDTIVSELCKKFELNLQKHAYMLRLIMPGDFPKTCKYIAKNNYNLGWPVVNEDESKVRLTKKNTKSFIKYFDGLSIPTKKIVFEHMLFYGLIKTVKKYKYKFPDIKPRSLKLTLIRTPSSKTIKMALDRNPNNESLQKDILKYGNIKSLKLLFKKGKNLYFWDESSFPPTIFDNLYLFIYEYCIFTRSIPYYELASEAILKCYYPIVNSLIMMKKLTPADKIKLIKFAADQIGDDDWGEIIKLLLKDPKLDLTGLEIESGQFDDLDILKILFSDPRINTQQNREIVHKISRYSKKGLDGIFS